MKGQVWLLNVWASWCVSCRVEHPLLIELAQGEDRPDRRAQLQGQDAGGKAWLAQHGDPYTVSVVDADGRVGIDWGVYGVPETFVVDKAGRHPLQADRPGHGGGARAEDPAAGPRTASVRERRRFVAALLLVASRRGCAAGAGPRVRAAAQETRGDAALPRLPEPDARRFQAPLADDLRREVRTLAVAGKSDDEIRAFLVARYGDFVLYEPPVKPRRGCCGSGRSRCWSRAPSSGWSIASPAQQGRRRNRARTPGIPAARRREGARPRMARRRTTWRLAR